MGLQGFIGAIWRRLADFARPAAAIALSAASLATPAPALGQTAQTITFAALSGKTFGNPPFSVSATASSGLTVGFSSLTAPVCTVSGTTVTIVTAGTCTVRASQPGNATYAPAPNVDRSFTVAKAAQWNSPGTPDTTLSPHESLRTRWG